MKKANKPQKEILEKRIGLIEKLLDEVNSKEEYDDLLKEKSEILFELEKIDPFCPKCKRKRNVKVLSDGVVVCNNKKCFAISDLRSIN